MDAAETALRIRTFLWSLPAAALGLVAGFAAGHPVLGAVVAGGAVFGAVTVVVGLSGRAAGVLHAPSGRTTPRPREHSLADSLVVRGRFDDAVAVLEEAVADDPSDPAPYLRLARIHRDHLRRFDDAARWFGRACRDARIGPGQEALALREWAEMHLHASGRPERAAPALARLAERRSGTPEGTWAADRLAALKDRAPDGEPTP